MKKTILALILVPVLGQVGQRSAEATPITGEIQFLGTAAWTGGPNFSSATGIDFTNPVMILEGISTGAYGGLSPATTATFTDLTGASSFGAPGTLGPLSVSPLWTFVDAGWTYSFNLASVTINAVTGTSRIVGGSGTATITGPGSTYEETLGTWSLSSNGTGASIVFSSASQVPDGGMTLVLLGGALVGLGALRRRFNL